MSALDIEEKIGIESVLIGASLLAGRRGEANGRQSDQGSGTSEGRHPFKALAPVAP